MKRSDTRTATTAVKAMLDAAKSQVQPPLHVTLRDRDLPFWAGIVRARARDEWIDADLVVASQLAKCQADIELEQAKLDDESTVLQNERGTMCVNPRVSVLEQYARRQMALMRALGINHRVTADKRTEVSRRKVERGAEKAREELEDEGLLAS